MTAVTGFDYSAGVPQTRPLIEWRRTMNDVLAKGGRRRVENNETFIYTRSGAIAFEVYATVPAGETRR